MLCRASIQVIFNFLGKSNLWISMYGLSFLIKHTVLCVVPLRARGLDVAVSLPQYFKENGYMTLGMLYIDTQLWVHCDKREVVKASFQKTNVQPKEWERCFTLGCQTRQREMTIQSLGMRRSWIGNWHLIIQFKHAQHTNVCQIFHTNSTDDPSNSWKAYTEEEMEETTLRSTWSLKM